MRKKDKKQITQIGFTQKIGKTFISAKQIIKAIFKIKSKAKIKEKTQPLEAVKFFNNFSAKIKDVFARLKTFLSHLMLKETALKVNEFLSPKFLILPKPIWAFSSMLLASAAIIALQTLLFHFLLIVSNYIIATSIIGLAMLGIAFGGLLSFLLSKRGVIVSSSLACGGLFISIIISYATIINIHNYSFPWPLLFPFFFASFIVANIYAFGGNTNILNFANCLGSGVGVLICLLLVPILKSETTLLIMLFLPCSILFLNALRTPNLLFKLAIAIFALYFGFIVYQEYNNIFFLTKSKKHYLKKKFLNILTQTLKIRIGVI